MKKKNLGKYNHGPFPPILTSCFYFVALNIPCSSSRYNTTTGKLKMIKSFFFIEGKLPNIVSCLRNEAFYIFLLLLQFSNLSSLPLHYNNDIGRLKTIKVVFNQEEFQKIYMFTISRNIFLQTTNMLEYFIIPFILTLTLPYPTVFIVQSQF